MASEKDVAAQKARAEKAEALNKSLLEQVAAYKKREEYYKKQDISDDDVKDVREFLLTQNAEADRKLEEANSRMAAASELEATHTQREKDSLIQSLASKYAAKDDEKAQKEFTAKLKDAEDPEKEALRLYVEGLESKGGEDNVANPAENVHDHIPAGGKLKKSPLDMNEAELKEFEAEHVGVKT